MPGRAKALILALTEMSLTDIFTAKPPSRRPNPFGPYDPGRAAPCPALEAAAKKPAPGGKDSRSVPAPGAPAGSRQLLLAGEKVGAPSPSSRSSPRSLPLAVACFLQRFWAMVQVRFLSHQSMKDNLPLLLKIVGVAVLYVASAKVGLQMKLGQVSASPVWPPAGIALAALLLLGWRVWPGVLLGGFVAGLCMTGLAHGRVMPALGAALVVGLGDTLEAVVGAWLAERFAEGRNALNQPQSVLRFVFFSAMVSSLFSASLGLTGLSLAGFERWHNFGPLWLSWWLGDMTSVVMLTPVLLACYTDRRPELSVNRLLEVLGLLLLLAGVCWLVFGGRLFLRAEGAHLSFLLIVPLLWAALRFGPGVTATLACSVGCIAILGTLQAQGPFTPATRYTSLLLLQNFIVGITVLALMLAADVAQRQHTDARLQDSAERYRDLFEVNPQPMWVYDYETLRILAVNNAAIQHYGYSRAEFMGLRLPDLWPPEEVPTLLQVIARARAGEPAPRQRRHRKKDGTRIEVEVSWHNLLFDRRPAAILLITDVTERNRAEQRTAALSDLGTRLSAAETPKQAARIIAETADALFGWDGCFLNLCLPDGTITEPLYYVDTVGGKRTEVEVVVEKAGPFSTRALQQGPQLVLRSGPVAFEPGHVPFGDLNRPSASLMHVPLLSDGRAIGLLSVQSYRSNAYTEEDLHLLQALADHCGGALERLRAEAAVRESEDRLRLALGAGNMGTWSYELGLEPRFLASPETERMFGLNPGEFDGSEQTLFQFIHPEDRARLRQALLNAATAKDTYELEFRFLPRGRPMGWILARGRAYQDAQGKPLRLVGIVVDITELKAAQEEVLRLNTELEARVARRTAQMEALNHELEAFCYSVSHDLRAPLRSVRGFGEVLLARYAKQLDARGKDFLQRSCEASQHMDNLIEDLLKLSRVGRTELRCQRVDLSALATAILAELQQAEPQRKVEVVVAPHLCPQGDERLLRIVLDNLLRNAWKFSSKRPEARIEVGVTPEAEPAFFVRDNGAGFDPAYEHKLFGVFQRLHSGSEFPGTGVGLATVQRIIIRHGGRVWATGALNAGATFYFTLPGPGGA
jgi:PAS domain S-box-containing protein